MPTIADYTLVLDECLAVDDVAAALGFARSHDLPVAVRAGGHSVAGLSLCDWDPHGVFLTRQDIQ